MTSLSGRSLGVRLTSLAGAALASLVLVYLARSSAYDFALLLLLCLIVLILAALSFAGRGRDLILMAASLVFALIAIEGIALMLDTGARVRNSGRYTQDYIGFNPALGAVPARPGVFDSRKVDLRSGAVLYDVAYTIDDNLLRRTISPARGPLVAFFGDSFTFGEGVGDTETLPQVFADRAGGRLRVLNFGFHGYGPQQFLRTLEAGLFDHLLRPDLALVVFQTAPWHAERTSCQADFVANAPRYELRGDTAVFAGACSGALWRVIHKQFERSAAFRLFLQPVLAGGVSRADMELYLAVITRAVQEARDRYGVPTVIVYLAYNDTYLRPSGLTNEEIVARFRAAGAKVLDATLAAPDGSPLVRYDVASPFIISGDGHPTALAQRTRAAMLFDFVAHDMPSLTAARP